MKKSGIYCIENKINGKKYIGQSNNINKRKNRHWLLFKKEKADEDVNKPLWNSVKKYGIDNFEFYILEECEVEKLNEKEIFWIKELKSHISQNGYNILFGGEVAWRGIRLSKSHRENIGLGNKGKKRNSEAIEKYRKSKEGFVVSEETKLKISKSTLGKFLSKEHKEKISKSHIGKIVSQATKDKIKDTMKKSNFGIGRKNGRFGKKLKNGSSSYFGICHTKNNYLCQITLNTKLLYIGKSKDEFTAIKIYDKYIIKNKIDRKINFPKILYVINLEFLLKLYYYFNKFFR